jgi:hypothetical protein
MLHGDQNAFDEATMTDAAVSRTVSSVLGVLGQERINVVDSLLNFWVRHGYRKQ